MKKYSLLVLTLLFVFACVPLSQRQANQVSTALTASASANTNTPIVTDTPLFTDTPASTATFTSTATEAFTPTITFTPSITATPTFAFPSVTVNQQAHCRYGPSVAYLHAADLYAGDTGTVRGRFIYSNWLFVKFDKLNYFCWVAPSVVDVVGDIKTVKFTQLNLQAIGSNQYGPPHNVTAVRDGNKVTVSWDRMEMTKDKDRGYFWELFICQKGTYIWWTDSYPDQYTTSFTVRDDPGCAQPSSGLLYTVEKHGYSEPVKIPWPAP